MARTTRATTSARSTPGCRLASLPATPLALTRRGSVLAPNRNARVARRPRRQRRLRGGRAARAGRVRPTAPYNFIASVQDLDGLFPSPRPSWTEGREFVGKRPITSCAARRSVERYADDLRRGCEAVRARPLRAPVRAPLVRRRDPREFRRPALGAAAGPLIRIGSAPVVQSCKARINGSTSAWVFALQTPPPFAVAEATWGEGGL